MKKALGILVPVILWAPLLFAQHKFAASASKNNVKVGEYFEINFSIDANSESFIPPNFSTFNVFTGPNSSIYKAVSKGDTIVNNTSYSYTVVATKEGIYNISPASIVISGHTRLLSNPLKITVKGQLTPDQAAKQQESYITSSMPDTVDIKNVSKQIFIRAEADKKHTYIGDPIKVTYKLYFCIGIDSSGKVIKFPDFNGFRVQHVTNSAPMKNRLMTEYLNGKKYNVSILTQYMVFPKHAGDLTITPFIETVVLPLQSPLKMVADSASGDNMQFNYELKSNPLAIRVRAISSKSKKQQ